jgi:hypothetical protein
MTVVFSSDFPAKVGIKPVSDHTKLPVGKRP